MSLFLIVVYSKKIKRSVSKFTLLSLAKINFIATFYNRFRNKVIFHSWISIKNYFFITSMICAREPFAA